MEKIKSNRRLNLEGKKGKKRKRTLRRYRKTRGKPKPEERANKGEKCVKEGMIRMPSITLSYKQTSEKCLSGFSNKVVTDNLGKNQFHN